ncbi:MAG TPA: hypothetical protein VF666_14395 [Pyrinomonadaceae bacterium]|jgi:hypothetical protein
MKRTRHIFLLLLLLNQPLILHAATDAQDAAKSVQTSQASAASLGNGDVLEMVKGKLAPDVIIAKIKSSASHFDTAPAALQQLKAEGVSDAVIVAMVLAAGERGANRAARVASESPRRVGVKIPKGLVVEVETAYRVNSQEVREGDAISFRVVNPLKVDGAIVIEAGATATARITKASRGGHFGRAGRLAWSMQEVTAVDGSRVPLELGGRVVGDSKGAKVATQTVVMGVLLGPFAPLSLLHGFKRGENASIPAGKRFEVFVRSEATVNVVEPR